MAASFACAVLTQESLLDLLFVGAESYCFTAGRGLAHADQMLEILASVANCADKKFATLEQLVFNHVSAVSGCICVLQQWDDARKNFVKKLRALGHSAARAGHCATRRNEAGRRAAARRAGTFSRSGNRADRGTTGEIE